jgi:hypothetical protein
MQQPGFDGPRELSNGIAIARKRIIPAKRDNFSQASAFESRIGDVLAA